MKISVLVIAHNEEKHIRKCLESISHQSRMPEEIVLVAHNCTDETIAIAEEFRAVRIAHYNGPAGSWHARAKGFEEITGDIVVCTDGDSYVAKNWVEKMAKPLIENTAISGVGSPILFKGAWWAKWSSYNFFYISKWFGSKPSHRPFYYFWGASFAVRKNEYEKVGGFSNFKNIHDKLGLTNWPDDCYLALLLSKIGTIKITYRTKVHTYMKETNIFQHIRRSTGQTDDGKKLFEWYKKLL